MCLIISCVFLALSIMFFNEGNFLNSSINGVISLFFIGLLIRNILKTKKQREENGKSTK